MIDTFRINFRYIILSTFAALAATMTFVSCSKDPIREQQVDPPDPPDSTITFSDGCFVLNEGNFNWGNASVTFFDYGTETVVDDLFNTVNKRSLGDVAESMNIFNGKGFIVVNNSGKIEVVSLTDFTSVKTIEGFNAPRYMEIIDSSKAYVTNLYGNISILNLKSLEVTGNIPTSDWTEKMIRYNQYVFVTSIGQFNQATDARHPKVYVISAKEDQIIDSIVTGKEPVGMVIDKKDKIWVLCTGGWDGVEKPALYRIDPNLRQVEKKYTFPSDGTVPSRLCINPGKDTLYFLNKGICRMPVTSTALPETPFIETSGSNLYGLDINPYNGTIWVTDAGDYVQNGKVYEYSPATGALLRSFKAGRIPSAFAFTAAD